MSCTRFAKALGNSIYRITRYLIPTSKIAVPGELELYDLKRVVGETKKLAKEQPEVVAVLLKLAQAFEWPEKLIGNAIALPKAPKGK
jgi:hypothetical protein